jgi:hypothetical protein
MFKFIRKLRIGILHAAYHRNIKHAESSRANHDIVAFKKYIYRAEDAWRKLVVLQEKQKTSYNG